MKRAEKLGRTYLTKQARRGISLLAMCGLLSLAGCNRGNGAGGGATLKDLYAAAPQLAGGSGYAQVTYQPNVRVLEQDEGLNDLVAESSNGHGLIFRSSNAQIGSLKDGDILVVKGLIARKVLGVDRRGDEVLVVTNPASLRDVVKEGDVHLEAPVRFGQVKRVQAMPTPRIRQSWMDLLATPAYAQSFSPENNAARQASSRAAAGATRDGFGNVVKNLANFAVGDWKITNWSATPAGDRLNVDLEMAKDTGGGFKAIVGAHGHITNFDFIEDIHLHTAFATTQLAAAVKALRGEMNFNWEIGKDSPGGFAKEDRIKLPASVSIPLAQYVGGLPLFLEISSALVVHPAITGGSQVAKGAFKVTYDGGMSITGQNGGLSGGGDANGNVTLVDDSGVSAIAPVGMVIQYCAPRLELSLGLKKIFPALEKGSDLAAKADAWLDGFAQKHLSPSAYQSLASSPLGTAVLTNSLKSEGDLFVQLVSAAGVTRSGAMILVPCSKVDIKFIGQMGVNANLFGVEIGENKHTIDVFTKDFSRVNPPGAKPCADIGT